MDDHNDSIKSTFRVLRSCQSLNSLGDEYLLSMINDSIRNFSKSLYDYDASLPKHLSATNCETPGWIPMTCATIHISNITSQFDMDGDEALCFMKHVHLLYRLDDFLETIPSLYAIHDPSSITRTIHDAFNIFDSTPAYKSTSGSTGSSHSMHDSSREATGFDCLAGKAFLEHDILELIELLHGTTVRNASKFNQRWYTTELRTTLLAMVQQLLESLGQRPRDDREEDVVSDTSATLRIWLHTTGASSVGTNYQFAFLACLVSARDQTPCLQGLEQHYLAQAFAQHVSASWRIWNDLGGRIRDEAEGAFSSCSFVVGNASDSLGSLVSIANLEADCTALVQKRLQELVDFGEGTSSTKSGKRHCLEFFKRAVYLSGDIYLAGDPTRSCVDRVA